MIISSLQNQVISKKISIPLLEKPNNYKRKQKISIIVKPTVDCNLNCVYCYEGHNPYSGKRMDHHTVKNIIKKFHAFYDENTLFNFVWHGGEPLLMGLEFYEKVFDLQNRILGKNNFTNGMQSNGTLLDQNFIDLLNANHVSIGISLDGPQEIHDAQRIYPNGKGSYDDVMKAINLRKEYSKENESGVLAVLTRNVLNRLDSFYNFFVNEKLYLKINPLLFVSKGEDVKNDLGLTIEELTNTAISLFDKWAREKEKNFSINPFDEILRSLLIGIPGSCIFNCSCDNNYLIVAPNGDIHTCAQWPFKNYSLKYILGNINTNRLGNIIYSQNLSDFRDKMISVRNNCTNCVFNKICNSGCFKTNYNPKYNELGIDYYCKYHLKLFYYFYNVLSLEPEIMNSSKIDDIKIENINNDVIRFIINDILPKHNKVVEDWRENTYSDWSGDWNERYSERTQCCWR